MYLWLFKRLFIILSDVKDWYSLPLACALLRWLQLALWREVVQIGSGFLLQEGRGREVGLWTLQELPISHEECQDFREQLNGHSRLHRHQLGAQRHK